MIDPEEFIERGRKAQEAVNALGAGKPDQARLTAELLARITAAKAALGDYDREYQNWISELDRPRPDFASWAGRFAAELRGLLDHLQGQR